MIIPSKFNGFHDGVRRCFGGGGGGGGGAGGDGGTGDAASAAGGAVGPGASGTGNGTGDGGGGAPGGDGTNYVYTPPAVNTNASNPGANTNFRNVGTSSIYSGPGVSTPQGMATLSAMKGTPWQQSGSAYNELLNQGFTSDQIRNSASTMYGAPSEANWGAMVQNAAMTSPTGRPMAGSDQFFQPVYQSSYQNYANPLTAFNTSTYGTTPARSNASQWWQGQGATDQQYMNQLRSQAPMAQNMNINQLAQNMQQYGISPSDMQAASSYGGSTYGGFNPGTSTTQAQQPFNPYTNSSMGYGGYGGQSSFMPQMQNPFMQPQQNMSQYMPQQNMSQYMPQQQYSQPAVSYPPMSNPFMPQSSSYNYQQPQYNPYQMQSPFSSQQPSYGGYSNYGGDFGGGVNMYTPVTQQPTQPVAPRSSGPTTPIVGRSAGFRGTPNVMRRAEGGIIDLMDKD